MSEVRSYYPFGDDLETGQSCKLWQELPMPSDPDRAAKRRQMKKLLFEAAFATHEDSNGNSLIPFHALTASEVKDMPPVVRGGYLLALKEAQDPRSGMIVIKSPLEDDEEPQEAIESPKEDIQS